MRRHPATDVSGDRHRLSVRRRMLPQTAASTEQASINLPNFQLLAPFSGDSLMQFNSMLSNLLVHFNGAARVHRVQTAIGSGRSSLGSRVTWGIFCDGYNFLELNRKRDGCVFRSARKSSGIFKYRMEK